MDRQIIKNQAIKMRRSGKSYNEISKVTGVAKSTLNYWFKEFPPSKHQSPEEYAKRWKKIQQLGALANKRKREKEIEEIIRECQKEVKSYPLKNLQVRKAILSSLYWAEGAKSPASCGVRFANTDPELMLLFLTLLRSCYPINEKRLRVRLHLHYYHKIKATKLFWANLLNIPLNQFQKIYTKKRSISKRFRKNFMGICMVRYDDTNLKHKIMQTALGLQKIITKHL